MNIVSFGGGTNSTAMREGSCTTQALTNALLRERHSRKLSTSHAPRKMRLTVISGREKVRIASFIRYPRTSGVHPSRMRRNVLMEIASFISNKDFLHYNTTTAPSTVGKRRF